MTTAAHPPVSVTPDRLTQILTRHWLLCVNMLLAFWAGLPWLAPVFMHIGWTGPARMIYLIYSLFCHQLPQRSWFLFGPRFTPSLAEVQAASGASADLIALRHFIGTPDMGWKLAWSDRMVSFYGTLFLFGLIYALLRGRTKGLRWPLALALLLPIALDGLSHAISDLWGIGAGFRDSNAWLTVLTGKALPAAFYAGDAWGSFNSLARLGTGLLAAFAIVFWLYPYVDRSLSGDEEPVGATNSPQGRKIA